MPNESIIITVSLIDGKILSELIVYPCPSKIFVDSFDKKIYYMDPENNVSGIVYNERTIHFDSYYGAGEYECKEQIKQYTDELKNKIIDWDQFVNKMLSIEHPAFNIDEYYIEEMYNRIEESV